MLLVTLIVDFIPPHLGLNVTAPPSVPEKGESDNMVLEPDGPGANPLVLSHVAQSLPQAGPQCPSLPSTVGWRGLSAGTGGKCQDGASVCAVPCRRAMVIAVAFTAAQAPTGLSVSAPSL